MKLITLFVLAVLGLAAQTPPDDSAWTRAGAPLVDDAPAVTATADTTVPTKAPDVAPSVAPVAVQPQPKRTSRAVRWKHAIDVFGEVVVGVAIAIAWVYCTGHQ